MPAKAGSSLMLVLLLWKLLLAGVADAVHMRGLPNPEGQVSFETPPIAPMQFLLISSPSQKKVVWTTLQNLESSDGRPFALVDSGLVEPRGLAFDHKRGYLYVADKSAKKIYRYTVLADMSGSRPTLATSGVRLLICQGHAVEWVAVDEEGNLFYTNHETNNINKISRDVMKRISKGEIHPSALQLIGEKELMAQDQAAKIAKEAYKRNKTNLPTDAPPANPHILSIYEAKLNSHVSAPSSLWAEGEDLYWTNKKDGSKSGTIVQGQAHPKLEKDDNGKAKPYPATALTNISDHAYGLGKTDRTIFFSRNGTEPQTGLVTGLLLGTDITIDFVTSIVGPRGLVWDKDRTMYVADEVGGNVWSFPAGRMEPNVPLTRAVTMKGAFGLVILSSDDPAFAHNKVSTDGEMAEYESENAQVAAMKMKKYMDPNAAALMEAQSSSQRANFKVVAFILGCILCGIAS
jgi:sugar lactone lactonase YvrE